MTVARPLPELTYPTGIAGKLTDHRASHIKPRDLRWLSLLTGEIRRCHKFGSAADMATRIRSKESRLGDEQSSPSCFSDGHSSKIIPDRRRRNSHAQRRKNGTR